MFFFLKPGGGTFGRPPRQGINATLTPFQMSQSIKATSTLHLYRQPCLCLTHALWFVLFFNSAGGTFDRPPRQGINATLTG